MDSSTRLNLDMAITMKFRAHDKARDAWLSHQSEDPHAKSSLVRHRFANELRAWAEKQQRFGDLSDVDWIAMSDRYLVTCREVDGYVCLPTPEAEAILEKLNARLAEFGKEPNDVAEFLRKKRVRGLPNRDGLDPVTRYLREQLGEDIHVDSALTTVIREEDGLKVHARTPAHIWEFIIRFNNGAYADRAGLFRG